MGVRKDLYVSVVWGLNWGVSKKHSCTIRHMDFQIHRIWYGDTAIRLCFFRFTLIRVSAPDTIRPVSHSHSGKKNKQTTKSAIFIFLPKNADFSKCASSMCTSLGKHAYRVSYKTRIGTIRYGQSRHLDSGQIAVSDLDVLATDLVRYWHPATEWNSGLCH